MLPFAHPERLWWLFALLPMAGWAIRGGKRRTRDWKSLGLAGRPPGDGSWGWFASMALIILALGQPRWGKIFGSDLASGHDVVLLVDVSRSMAAEDSVPNRLGVAIEAGSSLLKALEAAQGNRAAVVAFAGRGVVRCPLTGHLESAIDVLQSLRPGDVQPGGTDLGSALESAAAAFDDEEHAEGRTIVLFSDGEDHVGSWDSTLERLKASRIIVHSVAIGDPDRGHPIPADPGKLSQKERDSGTETRRSDVAVEAISRATGGAVIPLGLASSDLGVLFRERIEPTARLRRDDMRIAERVERFPSFLLPAIGLGLAASWPGLARRRGRRLAFSILAVALLTSGAGPISEDAAGLVALGRRSYEVGRFEEALQAFERAIALDPKAAVPRFDAASVLYQLRRHQEAVRRYEEARERGDEGLSIKVDYALGNTHLALGDIAEAVACYDACLASALEGGGLGQVRSDAAANREFASKRLKPPPPPPNSGGSSPPGSSRNRPSTRNSAGDQRDDPSAPRGKGTPPSKKNPGGDGGDSALKGGNRGAGGAGGGGQAPPEADSPEARLDSALKDVREARSRRPPDPPPRGSTGVGKDW